MDRAAALSIRLLLLALVALLAIQAFDSLDLISEAAGDAALLLSYGG